MNNKELLFYQKGLNDAWECIKKIDKMPYKTFIKIFGDLSNKEFFDELTPSFVLMKLKEYENYVEYKDKECPHPNNCPKPYCDYMGCINCKASIYKGGINI